MHASVCALVLEERLHVPSNLYYPLCMALLIWLFFYSSVLAGEPCILWATN